MLDQDDIDIERADEIHEALQWTRMARDWPAMAGPGFEPGTSAL